MENISNTTQCTFEAPKNSVGVMAYHTRGNKKLDDKKLTAFIEQHLGAVFERDREVLMSV